MIKKVRLQEARTAGLSEKGQKKVPDQILRKKEKKHLFCVAEKHLWQKTMA
jgi:hypothetical protein